MPRSVFEPTSLAARVAFWNRRVRLLRLGQCSTHLASDFAFADNGRVQSGAYGEEVLNYRVAFQRGEAAGQEFGGEVGACCQLVDQMFCCVLHVVHVCVDFEAVAGGQHDGAIDSRRTVNGGSCQPVGRSTDLCDGLQIELGMRCDKR